MNRPVCCRSETCPVHCLVPSRAARPPALGQEGRGPGGWSGRGWRRGGSGPPISRTAPGGYSPRAGALVQHARSGRSLVTRGVGGDTGVLGWGPRSPPVLHILIHSIFGTRKGTNISVLIASPPLPSGPLLVPLWLPSLPSLAPHCHCHPTRGGDAPAGLGLARVLVARPGALAQPPPLAELW